MKKKNTLDPEQKALEVNLDPTTYGTIAEIGAGQEVARHFFLAGGASGTIAKTMSAYDMTFSDEIYGKEKTRRYVSESRLLKMLDHEYSLVVQRLSKQRPYESRFFAFANTVATKNYQGTKDGHGWLGIRFQPEADGLPSEAIVHVRLLDSQTVQQQQTLGIIGVNLIYACFFNRETPEAFLLSLMDNLNKRRIEIDVIRVKGKGFAHFNNRLLSLWLVKHKMAQAVMFDKHGEVVQPADVLYKKNIFALRGSFRPPTHVNMNMLEAGFEQFMREPDVTEDNSVVLTELTTTNLSSDGELCEADFLARIDLLIALGQNVLLSNYHEYHRLSAYFARNTQKMIVMALGVNNLVELFNEKYYEDLPGGILQAFGEQFKHNVKLYVYPLKPSEQDKLVTLSNITVPKKLEHLFHYVNDNGYLSDYESYDKHVLHIFSREVLAKIINNEDDWGPMVPSIVEKTIKDKCLFGFTGGQCKVR